jgi:hypothetical protein
MRYDWLGLTRVKVILLLADNTHDASVAFFNLGGVNSPSPWGKILKLQCGACSASKSVSIPRPLAAGFFIDPHAGTLAVS